MALVDDPTIRMLRSGFGKQVKSIDRTDPAYGFGTSSRDGSQKNSFGDLFLLDVDINFQKQYLSKEQTKTMAGNNSQGPVYKYQPSIGVQPESKYGSSSSWGFGSSSRSVNYGKNTPGPGTYSRGGALGDMEESKHQTAERPVFGTSTRDGEAKVWLDEELMRATVGKDTPGPNSYKNYGGIGRMSDSPYETLPSWKQGTAQRFQDKDGRRDFPGAGTYTPKNDALGKQALSSKRTLPNPKIGTSTRDSCTKVFISKAHEKGNHGRGTPGPTTAPVVNSIGSQTLSSKRSNPSFGFGTAKRDAGSRNVNPGPGSYWA